MVHFLNFFTVFGDGCPVNWLGFNDSCYIINSVAQDWDTAVDTCTQLSGNLVSIGSEAEQIFVESSKSRSTLRVKL